MLIVTIQSIYNRWIVVIYGYIAYDRLIVIDSGWIMLWPHVVTLLEWWELQGEPFPNGSAIHLFFGSWMIFQPDRFDEKCWDLVNMLWYFTKYEGIQRQMSMGEFGKCSNKMDVPGDFNQTTLEISTTNDVICLGRVWIPRIRIPPIHGSLNKDNYE